MRCGLLVFPRLDDSFYAQDKQLLLTQRLEPSVLYVAPKEHDVEYIHDNEPHEGIDLYLCSVYTRGWNEFKRFAMRVGRDRILAGGYHPTALPKEVFLYASKVVTGYCGNIDEIIGKPEGIYPGSFAFTQMDRDLIPQSHYCQVYLDVMPEYIVGSMVSSVGCPFDCDFCSTPNMSDRKMRISSLDYVDAEIEDLRSRGVQSVFIRDESFATNKSIRKIAERFRGKFEMVYSFGTGNVMGANEDLVRHLAENGWHSLNFGLEDVAVSYRKNKRLAEAVVNCRKYGMHAVLSFIVNDDGKSQEEARTNYKALFEAFCELKPAQVCANFLMPLPGTGLWPIYKDRICEEDFDKYDSKTPIMTNGPLSDWHKRMIVAIQLKYYYSKLYREHVREFECGDTLHLRIEELKKQFGFMEGEWDDFVGF